MTPTDDALERLKQAPAWRYGGSGPAAAEPAALAGLALLAWGHAAAAQRAAKWLCDVQAADGSVGVFAGPRQPAGQGPSSGPAAPGWPTSLAVLLWTRLSATLEADSAQPTGGPPQSGPPLSSKRLLAASEAGLQWLLAMRGKPLARNDNVGHDTSLIGWPWVESTHSWLEPTALAVLALRAAGLTAHPRTREAVRLLIDRQLPSGGCNYGNTTVLGQLLRPHLQPSGLALLALAGEPAAKAVLRAGCNYVSRELRANTAAASLSWSLLGLDALAARPPQADEWLQAACQRCLARQGDSRRGTTGEYHLALLALAASERGASWLGGEPMAISKETGG